LIDDLDQSLAKMLTGEAQSGSPLSTAAISFAAPNQTWQSQGTGMQLDVYLYRILDNRELRSSQRNTIVNPGGSVTTNLFPSRIECSYIISAWDKSAAIEGTDIEPSEHLLLSQVLYALWRNPTMPTKYLTGYLLNAELALPIIAAETEDMAAKPDFWSALDTYVRPAITCRVTMEMSLSQDVTGPQATAVLTTLNPLGSTSSNEVIVIGGVIRNAANTTQTIPNAWLLLDASLSTYVSDANGAYRIGGIQPGPHTLTVRAVGFQQAVHSFSVPDPSGIYDISLTTL
jgi:hypothetical protein